MQLDHPVLCACTTIRRGNNIARAKTLHVDWLEPRGKFTGQAAFFRRRGPQKGPSLSLYLSLYKGPTLLGQQVNGEALEKDSRDDRQQQRRKDDDVPQNLAINI